MIIYLIAHVTACSWDTVTPTSITTTTITIVVCT